MADAGEQRKPEPGAKKGEAGRKKGPLDEKAREARAARREKTSGRRRVHLLVAIAHPLRRRILRVLADWGDPCSAAQIAKKLGLPVSMVGYHLTVLLSLGAVEPVDEQPADGADEPSSDATIEDDYPIEPPLDEPTEVDDEDK